MATLELRLAYLFWLPSLVGIAGLHRFYLGKPLSGLLFLMTGGLFGLGTLYDALTMPHHVRAARLTQRLDQILEDPGGPQTANYRYERDVGEGSANDDAGGRRRKKPGSVEQEALRLAAERHGLATPARVALRAAVSPEKARDQLDRLVRQGFAEVQVTREGMMVYVFPEFLDDRGREELEDLS